MKYENKVSPMKAYTNALTGISLAANMALLTAYLNDAKMELSILKYFVDSYKNFEESFNHSINMNTNCISNDLYNRGKNFLTTIGEYKKLPESQSKDIQLMFELIIKDVENVLHVE